MSPRCSTPATPDVTRPKLHRTSPSWQPWAYPPQLPPRALPDLAVSGPADRSGLRATRSDLWRRRVGADHHRQRRIDHRRVRPHRSRPRGAQRWSKNAAPDVLGSKAWRLSDIADRLDDIALEAWVGHGDTIELIQQGTLGDLLAPKYWLDVLTERGDARPRHRFDLRDDLNAARCQPVCGHLEGCDD